MSLFGYLGTDELLKKDNLDSDIKAWLGDQEAEPMAKEIYYGAEINPEQLEASTQSISFFNSKKAIVLKDFDKVHLTKQNEIAKLINPESPDTAIFIVAEKLDGRSALKKLLKSKGKLNEFKLPYSNKIPAWIAERAKKKFKRKISISSAHYLWEFVGDNTREIELELEKLDAFVPENKPITVEAIHNLLSKHRDITIFELLKTFGLRDKPLAYKALTSLLEAGEHPILITMRLFTHYKRLLDINILLEQGHAPAQICKKFRIHEFLFSKDRYLEQARARSQKTFKKILTKLSEIEYNLKSGHYTYNFEIEMEFSKLI